MSSQELVPSDVVRPALSDRRFRLDDPTPGTYWRTKKKLKTKNVEQCESPDLPKGIVLLLTEVVQADGEPHTYVMAGHPLWNDDDELRFHVDIFHDYWEPAPDGAQVREQELADLHDDMRETQRLLMSPPPDAVPAGLIGHDPVEQVGVPGQALATVDTIKAIEAYAEQVQDRAKALASWTKKHTTALGVQARQLAGFHTEKANVALAVAKAQTEGVQVAQRVAANLQVYVGNGIEVMQIRDGEPAPRGEKLRVLQECLAFDEECALHVESCPDGLDHTMAEELSAALADNSLVDRMIPYALGMVVVKFRRSFKEFVKTTDPKMEAATHRFNSQMSEEAKRSRLLLRDGDRLYLIESELFDNLQQLMPNQREMTDTFSEHRWGSPPKELKREDLNYAQAQRRQMGMLDVYAKVLIALWGLRDTQGLLADSAIPAFANWLDPAFQDAFLELCSHDRLIGEERPDYAEWRREQNSFLAPGSTVAVVPARCMNDEYLPGAFATQERYNGRTYEKERVFDLDRTVQDGMVARVQADKRGLFVEVPLVYGGYNKEVRRKTRNGKLYLEDAILSHTLVLDRVIASDLTYYLSSRKQRRQYQAYIELFKMARTWVAARDEAEATLRAEILKAAEAGRITEDRPALLRAVVSAMAIARMGRRDRSIPEAGTPAHKAYVKTAMTLLYGLVSDNQRRIESITAWAAANGRVPLRLVLSGKSDWAIYCEPTSAEHDARLGDPAYAAMYPVTFKDDGVELGPVSMRLLRLRNYEHVVHDFHTDVVSVVKEWGHEVTRTTPSLVKDWSTRGQALATLSYENAVGAFELRHKHEAWFAEVSNARLFRLADRYNEVRKTGSVERMNIRLAIGTLLVRGEPKLLVASKDAFQHVYDTGTKAEQTECVTWILSNYAKPESHIRNIKGVDGGRPGQWRMGTMTLADAHACRELDHLGADGMAVLRLEIDNIDDPSLSAKANEDRRVVVTTLTELGAKLFPELIPLTRAAA